MKDLEHFLQILKEPVPFADFPKAKEDKNACESLWKEFNETESDEIASVSYAYWIVSSNANAKHRLPADAQRLSALKEIRRHYVGEGRNYANTLIAIREALEYRRTYRFDAIRSCFYDTEDCEGEDSDLTQKYRRLIFEDLERQPNVVRGVDNQGRVISYKPPRKSPGDDEAYFLTQIYTAERAIATNEFTSKGKQEMLIVVFNFQDYSRANSPSSSAVLRVVKVLQRCYPERLRVLIIASPPFWIRGLFNVLWPFLSKATTEKFRLPSGQAAIDEEIEKIVGGNQELKVMLASGDISSVDLTDYTRQPFYCQFEQNI